MKTIKKLPYMMLATIVALTPGDLTASIPPIAAAQKPAAVKKSSLTQSQKAEQAALPFGKRMISKTGEGLGFESRGNMLQGKGKAKTDVEAQKRSFNTKDEINQAIRFDHEGIQLDNNGIIAKNKKDRTYYGGAKDKLVNAANYLTGGKTRQITTRLKDALGKETGEIRVDNMSPDGQTLIDTTIYAPDRKSFVTTYPNGKIRAELTPDGRRIENTYNQDTGNLQRRREIIENTLNIGSNRTVITTSFDASGQPASSTITKGSKISGQTVLNKEFDPNKNGNHREYIITDNATGNSIETREQDPQDPNSYITKDLRTGKEQKATLDKEGNLKALSFTSKDKSQTDITINDDGYQTTKVKDKDGNTISDITINPDGTTAQVMSVVPETYTLSGGLIGTGRNKIIISDIKNNRLNIDEYGGKTVQLVKKKKSWKEKGETKENMTIDNTNSANNIRINQPPLTRQNATREFNENVNNSAGDY